MARFALISFFLSATLARAVPSVLAPQLDNTKIEAIEGILQDPRRGSNLEALEMRYQSLVQRQIYSDLIQIYSPENRDRLEITYASFTPADAERPDQDLGYGLHVVKRLRRKLADGSIKVIDVNEAWAENRVDGGLYLPDEIRVKTRVFAGQRFVSGSSRQYLFDSIRVAWGPGNAEVSLWHRTRFTYDPESKKNFLKGMRVPVSSPFSCVSCHRAGDHFAIPFLAPGEKRNYEAIVQDSQFRLPPEQMRGYRQYAAYLDKKGRPRAWIERVKAELRDLRRATEVPRLLEALRQDKETGTISWLGEDISVYGLTFAQVAERQGVYQGPDGEAYIDAIEEAIEGKYRWWVPQSALPFAEPQSGGS